MAEGPDPNRNFDTDRDLTGEEQAAGGGFGSPRQTRLGLGTWASAFIAVAFVAALLVLML